MSEHKTPINSYRDLVVWQEAMNLAEATYRLTTRFPKEEAYGLTGQLRRSGSSVPANFANAGKPVSIAPASGNGHSNGNGHNGNGNGHAATKEEAAEAVAGD